MNFCAIEGCLDQADTHGWCGRHYMRWKRTGDPLGLRGGRWKNYVQPECSVEGCTASAVSLGFCRDHYGRFKWHGDPLAGRRPNFVGTDEEQFAALTQRHSLGCLLWLGTRTQAGYGQMRLSTGQRVYVHRWVYEKHKGAVPPKMHLDHICHNEDLTCPGGHCLHHACADIEHLEVVTASVNTKRGKDRARRRQALLNNGVWMLNGVLMNR